MSNHLIVHAVETYERAGEKKERWARIGVLFPHKSGQGFNVKLDFVPLNPEVKLVALPPRSDDEK